MIEIASWWTRRKKETHSSKTGLSGAPGHQASRRTLSVEREGPSGCPARWVKRPDPTTASEPTQTVTHQFLIFGAGLLIRRYPVVGVGKLILRILFRVHSPTLLHAKGL